MKDGILLCAGIQALAFTAYLLGQRRLYAFAAARYLGDGGP